MGIWNWIDTFSERQVAFASAAFALVALLFSGGAMLATWSQARSAKRTNELAEQLSAPAIDLVSARTAQWEGWIETEFIIKNQAIVRLQVPTIRCRSWGRRIVAFRMATADDGTGKAIPAPTPPKGVRNLRYEGEVWAVKDKPYVSARVHLLISEPVGFWACAAARSWSIIHRTDTIRLDVETRLMRTKPIITELPVINTPPSAAKAMQADAVHQVIVRSPNRWRRRGGAGV